MKVVIFFLFLLHCSALLGSVTFYESVAKNELCLSGGGRFQNVYSKMLSVVIQNRLGNMV